MADVRDWGKFVRGRWDWSRGGYERGFPRGCQFTDVDAAIEFDNRGLVIEPKHYDGVGPLPDPYSATGQLLFLPLVAITAPSRSSVSVCVPNAIVKS